MASYYKNEIVAKKDATNGSGRVRSGGHRYVSREELLGFRIATGVQQH